MGNKILVTIVGLLGLAFIVLAFVYWFTPASSLPSYFPGYSATLNSVHLKHGIASFVVGLVLLAFTWFRTGKKSAHQNNQA